MRKIDELTRKAKRRKHIPVEELPAFKYVQFYNDMVTAEYNGEPFDREPPEGFEEWANTPIELREPNSLDDESYHLFYKWVEEGLLNDI